MWFKVDDSLHSSRKVMSIPRSMRLAAVGLWTIAGSWSAAEELDGFVPGYMVAEWGATSKHVEALVSAGLWERVDDGTRFHKWSEYQPTRAELEAERQEKKTGGKHGNHKRWHVRRGITVAGCEFCESDSRSHNRSVSGIAPSSHLGDPPDPTRPDKDQPTVDPSPQPPSRGARGERIPEPFLLTGEMRAWAATEVPAVDLDAATREFVDYWRGVPGARGRKLDWPATWRNRIREVGYRRSTPKATRDDENLAVVAKLAAREAEQRGIAR